MTTPDDPDTGTMLSDTGLTETGPAGPIPPHNQPGHHPEQEQDQPDLEAFRRAAARPARGGGDDGSGAGSPSARERFERRVDKLRAAGVSDEGGASTAEAAVGLIRTGIAQWLELNAAILRRSSEVASRLARRVAGDPPNPPNPPN